MRPAERPGNLAIFGVTLAAKCLLHPQRGGCNMVFGLGLPQPHSSICLIPLWLAALKRPSCVPGPHVGLGRERPPPKTGGSCGPAQMAGVTCLCTGPHGVAHVLIYPCGKAWKPPPFPSRFIVSDRSSPSRVRFAASRPGRLRADPKDALLTMGKGGIGPWGARASG